MWLLSTRYVGLASAVAVLLFVSYSSVRSQRAPIQEVPQPDHVVSFVANFVQTKPSGARWAGKFYRRADESIAQHGTETLGSRSLAVSAINNVETGYSYLYREETGYWVRVPLRPRGSKQQRRYRVQAPGINGLIPEALPVAGFRVYRDQELDGSFSLLAPDLNFLPILYQLRSGSRREITEIQMIEPDPAAFLPPADAKVVDGKAPRVGHLQ